MGNDQPDVHAVVKAKDLPLPTIVQQAHPGNPPVLLGLWRQQPILKCLSFQNSFSSMCGESFGLQRPLLHVRDAACVWDGHSSYKCSVYNWLCVSQVEDRET